MEIFKRRHLKKERARQVTHIVSIVVNACVKITLRREYDSIQTLP